MSVRRSIDGGGRIGVSPDRSGSHQDATAPAGRRAFRIFNPGERPLPDGHRSEEITNVRLLTRDLTPGEIPQPTAGGARHAESDGFIGYRKNGDCQAEAADGAGRNIPLGATCR